jgi:hypothetical protein
MQIPGQRFKRTRLIQTDKFVVAVEVDMVVPELLREIRERADQGGVAWLAQRGKVYAAVDAA